MPDTPRTRAELLADFANQQSHAITPQKMRNFVESVAEPVPGGGLGTTPGHVVLTVNSPVSIANDSLLYVPFDTVNTDPNGWVHAASFTSSYSGTTVAANSSIDLPIGVYLWSARVHWPGPPSSGKSQVLFDFTDQPAVGELLSDVVRPQSPMMLPMTSLIEAAYATHRAMGYWYIHEEGQGPVALEVRQTTGAPLNLALAALHVMAISGPGI